MSVAVLVRHGAQEAEIGSGERIGLAELAQRDVLRGPLDRKSVV